MYICFLIPLLITRPIMFTEWFVVLFIRGGVFEGGAFRAQLSFSALHPEGGVPRVTFDPPVFHPLVNALTGEMDISCKIDKWR